MGEFELHCFFFFFKQKTAYEIGTGDWSSDVCSSDLEAELSISDAQKGEGLYLNSQLLQKAITVARRDYKIGRASCRERV